MEGYAYGHMVVLGGGQFLMSEVPLYLLFLVDDSVSHRSKNLASTVLYMPCLSCKTIIWP